jgi:membrane-associated protease RseP (regulator of RpoE activity)
MQTSGYVAAVSINDRHREVIQRKADETRTFMFKKGLALAYTLALDKNGLGVTLAITGEVGKGFTYEFSGEVLHGNFEILQTTERGITELWFGYSPE